MLCFKNSNIVHTQNDMTLSLDYKFIQAFPFTIFRALSYNNQLTL